MNRRRGKQNNGGYTLAEMLITVGIIVILSAVAFVSVSHYMKTLKQTELDSTAREIFVAAQNHAAVSKAGGSWDSYIKHHKDDSDASSLLGTAMEKPTDWNQKDDGISPESVFGEWDNTPERFYYIVISSDNAEKGIRKYLLPTGSIDGTLRGERNIIVEYDAKTAAVYGVWYAKAEDQALQNSSSVRVPADSSLGPDRDLRVKANRLKLSYRKMIGYYGGAAARSYAGDSSGRRAPAAAVTNNDRLTLNILDRNKRKSIFSSGGADLTVTVKGDTSGASKKIPAGLFSSTSVDNGDGGTLYSYDLDSVTDGTGGHFAEKFKSSDNGTAFIPGENLTITVETEMEDGDAGSGDNDTYSVELHTNSLFADLEGNTTKADDHTAVIRYGRQMENLSTAVSDVDMNVSKADIQKNIDWRTALFGINDSDQENRVDNNLSVNLYNGETTVAPGKYYSVTNADLDAVDGNGFTLSNFDMVSDSDGYAGLIGTVKDKNFGFSDIHMKGPIVTENDRNGCAGTLIGRFNANKAADNNVLTITNCILSGSEISVTSDANAGRHAGGLAGRVDANGVTLSGVSLKAGSLKVTANRGNEKAVNGDERGYKQDGGYGNAGGLFGYIRLKDSSLTLDKKAVSVETSKIEINGCNSAGALIGKMSFPNTDGTVHPSDLNVSGVNIRFDTLQIHASEGYAGGIAGHLRVKQADFENVSLQPANRNADSLSIRGDYGYAGGLAASVVASGNIKVADCGVDAGLNGTVTGGMTAGGLLGLVRSDNKIDMSDSYATAYVEADGTKPTKEYRDFENAEMAAGGFAGILSAKDDSSIEQCYSGGRTAGGKYMNTDDAATAGRYNVIARNNAYAGGFAGYTSDFRGTIRNSYTTSSVKADGTAGGFLGYNTENGSHIAENCYTTALVSGSEAGTFLGQGAREGNRFTDCYYLDNVPDNVTNDRGNGDNKDIDGVSAVSTGTYPFNGNGGTAAPYDTPALGSSYSYRTVTGLAQKSQDNVSGRHVGDWPVVEETAKLDAKFFYYEIIDGETYYHGYDVKNNGESLNEAVYTEKGGNFLSGHGKYVSESGYLLLIKKGEDYSVGFNTVSNGMYAWLGSSQNIKNLSLYKGKAEGLPSGYDAYVIDFDSYNKDGNGKYFSQLSQNGVSLFISKDTGGTNRLAMMSFTPFFSDTVKCPQNGQLQPVTEQKDGKYHFSVRSADQLKALAEGQSVETDWQNLEMEQQLDITYDTSKVTFTNPAWAKTADGKAYVSPTIPNLGKGNQVTYCGGNLGTGESPDYYVLDSLNTPFAADVQCTNNNGIRDLHVTNMKADYFVGYFHDGGMMNDITIENSRMNIAGLVRENGRATIENCRIINANIGQYGFAEKNSGTIENCQIYSDASSYNRYLSENGTKNFALNTKILDNEKANLLPDADVTLGYNLVTVGMKTDGSYEDTAAGFVGTNGDGGNGKISRCSFTGKIYASNKASGFADNNNGATIEDCYSNALITGTETNSTVAGFIYDATGGTVQKCHSTGILNGGTGAGFVYDINNGSLQYNYSALWENHLTSFRAFYQTKPDWLPIHDNAYLTDILKWQTDSGEGQAGAAGMTSAELAALTSDPNYGQQCTPENTVLYNQYTTNTPYPYPMPADMKAYGDWK